MNQQQTLQTQLNIKAITEAMQKMMETIEVMDAHLGSLTDRVDNIEQCLEFLTKIKE
jgi:prefoldin subunit 5